LLKNSVSAFVLKGRSLSRAVTATKIETALAAAGLFAGVQELLQQTAKSSSLPIKVFPYILARPRSEST